MLFKSFLTEINKNNKFPNPNFQHLNRIYLELYYYLKNTKNLKSKSKLVNNEDHFR